MIEPFMQLTEIETTLTGADHFTLLMCTAWPKHKHATPRRMFTAAEDAQLLRIVDANPGQPWEMIASQMGHRSARQCRERYANYLAPSLRVADWTAAEDSLLLEKINELGSAWAVIRLCFNGRSENDIKNRWYSHLRFSTYLDRRSGRYYFLDPSQSAFSVRRKRFRVKVHPNLNARKILDNQTNVHSEGMPPQATRGLDCWPDFGEDCFDIFASSEYF
jgi:hypothetical protein